MFMYETRKIHVCFCSSINWKVAAASPMLSSPGCAAYAKILISSVFSNLCLVAPLYISGFIRHGICCPGKGLVWQEASCFPLWGFSKYYEAQFNFFRNVQAVISVLSFNVCCISSLSCKRNLNVSRHLFEILVHKDTCFKNWNVLHLCDKG